MFRTRFAPSPTGPLHLGHAFSAIRAFNAAQANDGSFHLRIDDLDQTRARPAWEDQIYTDLTWLGLSWDQHVRRQSECLNNYTDAIEKLGHMGLTYPCACSRSDIELAANAPQEGVPDFGPDGRIYPGTCRHRTIDEQTDQDSIRLNMQKAAQHIVEPIEYVNNGRIQILDPKHLVSHVGDVILRRRAMGAAYHLAVVVDDHLQAMSHVVRGKDLEDATQIHVLLQHLLGYKTPVYTHHRLIRDDTGKRLAKRNDARAIATYRDLGHSPQDIYAMIGLTPLGT